MNANKSSLHILFASRLVLEKGVDILIDAIDRSISSGNIIWHIASDGTYEGIIRKLSEQYPDQVLYYGKVSQERLSELYRKVDFLFMPSRFLETFGLTALESLASGSPVIGFRKGGLSSFIPPELALDRSDPTPSLFHILEKDALPLEDVSGFSFSQWQKTLLNIFHSSDIMLIHDYHEKIGGAEYYVDRVGYSLGVIGKRVSRYSYRGTTSPWKRRFLFILSLFDITRYFSLSLYMRQNKPKQIWMHSVMRYIGFWGLLAVRRYHNKNREVEIFLSHHDLGMLAPFPQNVTEEDEIPASFHLSEFVSHVSGMRKIIALVKWCYVLLYRHTLPVDTTHILFAPFMEKHIKNHFPKKKIILFPHSYDEKVFHP